MSTPESNFSKSWATLVDFIASSYFLCDMVTTDILQNLLPPRVLNEDDQVPFIKDFSHLQNRAVILIDSVYAINEKTQEKLESFWYIFNKIHRIVKCLHYFYVISIGSKRCVPKKNGLWVER